MIPSMTIDLKSEGLLKLRNWSNELDRNLSKGIRLGGAYAEGRLKRKLKGGNPTTFFYKSPHKELRSRKGALRASINSVFQKGAGGPQARVGTPLLYGLYGELGATIPVSGKMRRYLHARGIHLRKKTRKIKIPARPWFMPTVRGSREKIISIVRQAIDSPLRK